MRLGLRRGRGRSRLPLCWRGRPRGLGLPSSTSRTERGAAGPDGTLGNRRSVRFGLWLGLFGLRLSMRGLALGLSGLRLSMRGL
ncbi:MAG TPA: hypothetical protein VME44_26470, partial [Streptosporangiaceae bacterium]|nr:hypothetical protein [Streptosporangiaceae bacterium]